MSGPYGCRLFKDGEVGSLRVMGRWRVGVLVLSFGLAACGRVSRDTPSAATDAASGGGAETADAALGAGATHDVDATPDASPCDPADAGAITWAKAFTGRSGVGTLAPAGLTVCGDGLCSVGNLVRVAYGEVPDAQTQYGTALVKFTPEGALVWSQAIEGPSATDSFSPNGVAADAQGNLVVIGGCRGQLVLAAEGGTQRSVSCPDADTNTHEHLLVLRFDSAGLFLSSTDFGTSSSYPPNFRVAVDPSGRTVVAVHVGGYSGEPERALVVSWGADGVETFRHSFAGGLSFPTGLALDAQGNAVLAGFFSSVWSLAGDDADGGLDGGTQLDTSSSAVCAFKLNLAGDLVWSRCFGGFGQQDLEPQLALGPDGSVVLGGAFTHDLDFAAIGNGAPPSPTRLSTPNEEAFYVAKLTADGDFAWQQQFGNGLTQDPHYGIAITPDSAILFPGQASGALAIGDLNLDAGTDAGSDSLDTPFVAEFDASGHPVFVTPLGHEDAFDTSNGIVLADGLGAGVGTGLGGCRNYYLAGNGVGALLAPGGAQTGEGFVLIAGRY